MVNICLKNRRNAMKQTYIRCPRCELNFILKKDRYCNVCKKEMKALGSMCNDDDLDLELCPVCKVNYINPNEDMCAVCAKEKALSEGEEKDEDNSWDSYTAPEDDEAGYSDEETSDMVSITSLDDDPLETEEDMPLSIADEEEEDDDDDDDEKGDKSKDAKKKAVKTDDDDLDDFDDLDEEEDEEDDDYEDDKED